MMGESYDAERRMRAEGYTGRYGNMKDDPELPKKAEQGPFEEQMEKDLIQYAEVEPIMQFFRYSHLPEKLKNISRAFCGVASSVYLTLPRNPERTVALRKLLEAKDCAVRADLYVTYS